jgi:hypothetical protein
MHNSTMATAIFPYAEHVQMPRVSTRRAGRAQIHLRLCSVRLRHLHETHRSGIAYAEDLS